MLRVLLVTDTDKPIGDLRQALSLLGYHMLDPLSSAARLPQAVATERPDIVIVDTESPSRDTLENLAVMNRTAPRPVLMFSGNADQQIIRAAVGAGVTAYMVEGLAPAQLAPIIEVAMARFAQEAELRERLSKVESELAERKLIDRAKRHLIERRNMTEPQAYATLRKHAMDRGMKLAEVARQLLAGGPLPE